MLAKLLLGIAVWTIVAQSCSGQYPGGLKRNPTRGYFPKNHPCEKSSCYPQTGNLLIGRENQLFASSTCGLREPERYCIVSHLEDPKKCFWCDSQASSYPRPELSHNISNTIYRYYPGTKQKTWWQSENGKENVYIQLDLEAEFHFTHIIITFKTFRPAAMLIERSYDYKKTWQVYRYFAHNCEESFPGIPTEQAHNLTDVTCESKYSNVEPSTDGEIIYRVLLPHFRIDNPYSHEVQTLMRVTNLRINFTKLHTLGDDLLDRRMEIQEKYYYAITDMVVRGSCSCYGHAHRCVPLQGPSPKVDMVHGRCECTHNTKGRNCEKCEDFYNDLPWGPAVGKQTNTCKPCNCNNHATSCHFDPAAYEASGKVSGGVCDGCKHNTTGPNCEQCKSFYYRDPAKDIQDPEVCRPCDCDPHGSLDSGICDSTTDPNNNLIAGACHCKTNVEGRRCDYCKGGFWNFTMENPDGCESCTCNTWGTINNQGCNVYTGECTCKRYVMGRDCNQCMPEFWGLSDKNDGCEACDCDPGGSFDNNCDVLTGQCKCRDHMTGRNCTIPKQQHFTASLDFLLYEAELAKSTSNCQVVIREPYRDGRKDTWTGTGFVKAFEDSNIIFDINNIRRSMNYDVSIRYEAIDNWEDITMKILRPDFPDPNGYCKDVSPQDDIFHINLNANSRSHQVFPAICLEEGLDYQIQLTFKHSSFSRESPQASVLIDAIVLVPNLESIPWYHGSAPAEARRRDYENNQCDNYDAKGPVSEVCKHHYNSIGAFIFNGALSCQCDPTGSVSKLCSEYGGFCNCKPNVVGRRCDRCAPGTYGFGPEGCIACDCNSIGAMDNYCNATTGQCNCRSNTYGRQCDQCRTGFWNFPNCQRCDCNGHADICDSRTGACDSCRDNTHGHTCDSCIEGFYGDPRLSADIPCRPCRCPDIAGSGHSFAGNCSLDVYTTDVVCECQEGYSGPKCDVCSDNFYGNPEEAGGSCQPCDCSNKIDLLKPGNCDARTGHCKQCLYDTIGEHCEICRPGYYRQYDSDVCIVCDCHPLGTNSTIEFCDHNTGQCPCLPNVIGKECGECTPNHWKIASGVGCESCNCDPIGSLDPQCNLYDGQCNCKPNYGGRQCNECKANYWGNAKLNKCQECTCDIHGSATMQCDRKTGACDCHPGIGGYKCDRCAKGYIGDAPNCAPCGECFDNWDRILTEHKNNTEIEIERAKNIKKVGATGAYTKEFEEMEHMLNEVENLLNSTETIDLDSIDKKSKVLNQKIKEINEGILQDLSSKLAITSEKNKVHELQLQNLNSKLEASMNQTSMLLANGTVLQEGNVQGALHLIEQAKVKADRAVQNAESSHKNITYAERQCKAADNLMNITDQDYNKKEKEDKLALQDIRDQVDELTKALPDMNNLVCDRQGSPCDAICGGAGCNMCGDSVSCENGAKQQSEIALMLANTTENILKKTEAKAYEFIRNVTLVNTTLSKQNAKQAFDAAEKAYLNSNKSMVEINNNKKQIKEFMSQNTSSPKELDTLAKNVLNLNINLEPNKIKTLADKIKKAVDSLTNIEPIIEETKDDLKLVNQLKSDADATKLSVQQIKNTTVSVKNALENSKLEQKNADDAIKDVNGSLGKVREHLTQIEEKTNYANEQVNKTAKQINDLHEKMDSLQLNVTKNAQAAATFMQESKNIKVKVKESREKLDLLNNKYNSTKNRFEDKIKKADLSSEKATELVKRAVQLTATVTKCEEDIRKIKSSPGHNLKEMEDRIEQLMMDMEKYNKKIEQKSDYFKQCT
ncbi:PREDICTED: laminin subunit beta-1 isoform X2 [Nicrophorus vespilloides]|uniref:Laminin subunit beta-1 isoform X2 n=1 Tax=Nicrophorus vespilloides TaxID=110193 RepID=A0ABM1N7G8_NICVS|nr:PREDICTED: laminin subunit beta-1 isoform X2 [Nicrophorus vespilloides]